MSVGVGDKETRIMDSEECSGGVLGRVENAKGSNLDGHFLLAVLD
jgi:hypothetical protein